MEQNEFYNACLMTLFRGMMERDYDILEVNNCIKYVSAVVFYRRQWTNAQTPETTALAAWSRDLAITDLYEYMRYHCFSDEMKSAVKYLTTHKI